MNFKKISLLLLLFGAQFALGQVKIGENPSIIDPSSIVELESTDKAFVLTRLTTVQMQGITPLNGAIVYNTDTECIHYFDGSQWNNLCENTGTARSTDSSIVTENGDGTYTFSSTSGTLTTFYGAEETTTSLVNNLDGTYTYTNENGEKTTFSTANTGDLNLTTDGTSGNIGIDGGNTVNLNVDDADADAGNEIQDLQYAGGIISLSDDPDATTIDISGIATNATDIDALEAEQITQNDAIALNTAKTGITTEQADIIANTSGINTGDQDISGIAVNATNIATNVAGISANTSAIAANDSDIATNAAAITSNDTDIATNATDIDALEAEQLTQNNAIAINTAKTGITTEQADIIANTSGINTGDQDISGIAVNATNITTNVTGISANASAIAANDSDIATNTAAITSNDTDIANNASDIDALEAEQITQNDAIALNTAKTGITTEQADIIANTSGVNTGDQDISGIAVNATNIATNVAGISANTAAITANDTDIANNTTDIDTLEAEQLIQNDAIALNTAKTGITTEQADIIANTSGVNTGDQDISGIAVNAANIATNVAGISANATAITSNDTDIAANATDIDALEAEQLTQNDAIALNTAKTGITTEQADIIANTSGVNTGDQDISGIAVNATNITTNASEIAANDSDIAANTTAITSNDTDIA
ncbi:beta strand repeat-containing protein, partial [Maribacter polysaccharolyticus]|uniref:beta strand repeat-containing protein n=1 Tax=Maribacter polysaccharolyticus TaxID=3020831 RepID=UPI00237F59A5